METTVRRWTMSGKILDGSGQNKLLSDILSGKRNKKNFY